MAEPIETRVKDRVAWPIGDQADVDWIAQGTAPGRRITAGIPPVGREVAGSLAGRHAINELLLSHGLRAATAELPHREDGISSIDHVAIPSAWTVTSAERVVAADERGRLSDHDAYVVETAPGS